MIVTKYLGPKVNGRCEMCHETSFKMQSYKVEPSIPQMADWESLIVCKKCARREMGRGWKAQMEALHA
jgi:hypothetical protein